MRGLEVPLVLLALALCLVSRGSAAPVTVGRATVLAKMNPRGSHWAVGHLMGKKRADSPPIQEEESLKEQLREYVQWEEATKNLLSLLQAKAARGHQPPPQEPLSFPSLPGIQRTSATSETQVRDLRVLSMKEGTPR